MHALLGQSQMFLPLLKTTTQLTMKMIILLCYYCCGSQWHSSFTAQFLFSWLTWMQHSEEEICENACLFNACKEIG
jgi:hypothetical protein